jgi:hypothetical protein
MKKIQKTLSTQSSWLAQDRTSGPPVYRVKRIIITSTALTLTTFFQAFNRFRASRNDHILFTFNL